VTKGKEREMARASIPEVMNEVELERFFGGINVKTPTGLRNYCIFRLMADCGLREAEVASLGVRDVNTETGEVMVRRGKGGKDRKLWANPELCDWLRQWNQLYPVRGRFFIGLKHNKGGKLSGTTIRRQFYTIRDRVGLPGCFHPHTLRHTFATDLLRDTRNLRLVQKALGHSQITTTEVYTHIVDEEVEEAMKGLRGVA
jgi:site-specific recombinase XerD